MSKFPAKVFIAGGAGTLGKAVISRSIQELWDTEFTVYSRDAHKQDALKRMFPKVRCVIGDIRDTDRLSDLMVGHDLVIHAAAIKHIPQAEENVGETISINVDGSISVAYAAINAEVKQIVGISTDKVCHACNVYGATKYLMEKFFQSMSARETKFNLVRYGNVIGSVGSVVQVWRDMLERDGVVRATDPDMTRFWITPDEAVTLILKSLDQPSGTITIPFLPATTMAQLAEYVLPEGVIQYTGLRPGEKRNEEMLTQEEGFYAEQIDDWYVRLWPTTTGAFSCPVDPLVSNNPAFWLSKDQVLAMIGDI